MGGKISVGGGAQDDLKIMTYNVHAWTDQKDRTNVARVVEVVARVVEVVGREAPDLLCLQEANVWGNEEDGLDTLRVEGGFTHCQSFNGLAVLGREGSTRVDGWGSHPNGFLLCRVEVGGMEVLVVNLHPNHELEKVRMEELRRWEARAGAAMPATAPQVWQPLQACAPAAK